MGAEARSRIARVRNAVVLLEESGRFVHPVRRRGNPRSARRRSSPRRSPRSLRALFPGTRAQASIMRVYRRAEKLGVEPKAMLTPGMRSQLLGARGGGGGDDAEQT